MNRPKPHTTPTRVETTTTTTAPAQEAGAVFAPAAPATGSAPAPSFSGVDPVTLRRAALLLEDTATTNPHVSSQDTVGFRLIAAMLRDLARESGA